MIKIVKISHTTYKDKEVVECFKDNKLISEEEFDFLSLRKCYYEAREVYYQKDGLDIRVIRLIRGDNEDAN